VTIQRQAPEPSHSPQVTGIRDDASGADGVMTGAVPRRESGAPDRGRGRRTPRPPRPGRPSTARLLSRGSKLTMWAGLALGLFAYILFGLAPLAGNLLISVTNYSSLAGSTTSFTGFANYVSLMTTEHDGFTASLEATVIFVTGVTIIQNALALLVAHRLQGEGTINALLRTFVFLPVVLGVTIIGLVWILVFNPHQGPAASLFSAFGLHPAFFGSNTAAMPLVIGVQIWQNLGFSTLIFIGGLRAINPDIYEAASLDGIGPWQRLRRITFPLLAPTVTANVLLAVVGSFTTYNLIYVLTDGQYNTDTLGLLAFNSAFGQSANLGLGAAVSIVLFVFTLVVALPVMYLLRYRERRLLS
jgi:ABC-type sugar transport system permease subunit